MPDLSSMWMLATVLGPIVIAAAIAYALFKRRQPTPGEQIARHEKIDEMYDDTPEQHRRAELAAEAEDRRREPAHH